MRAIDAEGLRIIISGLGTPLRKKDVMHEIDTMPTITLERKRGRWMNIDESEKWRCSECGRIMWFSPRLGVKPSDYKFCPNCGAEMPDKGEDE